MAYYHLDEGWSPKLVIYSRGIVDKTFTLREYDKSTKIQLQASDVIRFKLWSQKDATPILDLDNVAATANGSVVTVDALGNGSSIDAAVTVRFAGSDFSSYEGEFVGEIALVDDSDSDRYKPICRGVVEIRSSPTGDRGLT